MLAVSSNSHEITVFDLSVHSSKNISYWPLGEEKYKRIFSGHEHNIPAIDFDNRGEKLASASIDSTLRVWELKTGSCIAKFLTVGGLW